MKQKGLYNTLGNTNIRNPFWLLNPDYAQREMKCNKNLLGFSAQHSNNDSMASQPNLTGLLGFSAQLML